MKSYPSINRISKIPLPIEDLFTFEKIDGSNLRVEWSKKQGWYKFGTRTQLLAPADPTFGPAIPLFQEKFAEPLTKIAKDNKWESVVVFGEYYGPSSFAGQHVIGEPMNIKIFDISPYKQGILSPQSFLNITKDIEDLVVKCYGTMDWDENLIDQIKSGSLGSFEGVVGKKGVKNDIQMYKAKSDRWIQKVRSLYNNVDAEKIIES